MQLIIPILSSVIGAVIKHGPDFTLSHAVNQLIIIKICLHQPALNFVSQLGQDSTAHSILVTGFPMRWSLQGPQKPPAQGQGGVMLCLGGREKRGLSTVLSAEKGIFTAICTARVSIGQE